MGVSSNRFAEEAVRLLGLPEIPYVLGGTTLNGLDCQGAVKYCAQRLGLKLSYSGSNDMYRNACSWTGTLAEAQAQRRIVPGAVAFIVAHDGQEAAKYKADGLGNASHIGIITMSGEAYSVDASSSAGKVRSRNERDSLRTWTHIGWLKGIDYAEYAAPVVSSDAAVNPPIIAPTMQTAMVTTLDGGALNLRSSPTESGINRIGRAPNGSMVEVLESRPDWTKVRYDGMTAWAQTKYLTMSEFAAPELQSALPASAQSQTPSGKITITIPEEMAWLLYYELDSILLG